MARGESLDLGVQGSAFHAAPLAPINNVRGTNTSHLHAEHIKNNVIHPGCADCGEIATIASKARAASKAAEFTTLAEKLNAEGRPPLAEAPTISVTMPGEEAKTVKKTKAQRKAPRFSKTEGSFINVSTSAGAAEARKNLGNAVPSGKPAWKSDIDKARAGGHISKAEALELKVSSGSLPEDKSNFKDEE
jgi:hypothetical protein